MWMLLSVALAGAPTLEQRQGPARAAVAGSDLANGTLRLSDHLTVRLTVEGPPPLEVELPVPLTVGPGWQVAGAVAPPEAPTGQEPARWDYRLEVEPLQPGELPLRLPPLRYRSGTGPWQDVTWQPIPLRVTTVVPKADPDAVRDTARIEAVLSPPGIPGAWWAALAAAVLAGLGLAALTLRRRRPRPGGRCLPPEAVAREELGRLAADLPRLPEESRAFYDRLGRVVRDYLADVCGVPARPRTTAEFCTALTAVPHFPHDHLCEVENLLRRCDLARFTPLTSSRADGAAALQAAGELVERVHLALRPPPPQSARPATTKSFAL